MVREVDVKALVSHIVKGDGADKCRICMGDTSEGQVYLGDTVMMDGERPVILAELLEVITGVEVQLEDDLPLGLCLDCSESAINAAEFRTLCRHATEKWTSSIQLLQNIPDPCEIVSRTNQSLYLIVDHNNLEVLLKENRVERYKIENDEPKAKLKNDGRKCCRCPDCGKRFRYNFRLFDHLKDSLTSQACYICAEVLPKENLALHLKESHRVNALCCKKCPAVFRSKVQRKKHNTLFHGIGGWTCGDCGRCFSSVLAIRAHIAVHSLRTCRDCDLQFRNQQCYIHHVQTCCRLESNLKNLTPSGKVKVRNENGTKKRVVGLRGGVQKECYCDYCNKKFLSKKYLCAHIQIVHLKNTHSPCQYCGKYLAAAHMTEHLKRHERTESFTCNICGIVLRSKLGYSQHLRLHTGEKPYACKICGETFSASSRRSEHIRNTHKNKAELVLKHVCEFCPAKFRLPYLLRKHVVAVHKNGNLQSEQQFECPDCEEKFSSCRGLLHHSRKHQEVLFATKKQMKEMGFKVYSKANATE